MFALVISLCIHQVESYITLDPVALCNYCVSIGGICGIITSSAYNCCGDGHLGLSEDCDDGNTVNGDGCSSTCGNDCGNGNSDAGETCDDGNIVNGDGCNSTCQVENDYQCTGYPSTCSKKCGNGSYDSGEQCDDSGTSGGDGCSSTCQIESGYECDGNYPSTCNLICTNGNIDGSEACDDGNSINNDGCSNSCIINGGWECSGNPSSCNKMCSNSVVNPGNSENCDDGNLAPGDGCNNICQIESGYECFGSPSSCNLICSNGNNDGGENCDDGNVNIGDGCDSSCNIESGWECDTTTTPDTCNLICSNGRLDPGEDCDDSNLDTDDGCEPSCQVHPDWECFGEPSVCNLKCVNGKLDGIEECDDNNLNSDDGCSPTCEIEFGYECSGEPSTCSPICGDGSIIADEICDDGNTLNKDGCSDKCIQEDFHTCLGEPSICNKSATPVFAASEAAAGKGVQGGIGSSVAIGSVASMFLNIPTDGIWTLINALQILHYMPMLVLYFPQNVLKMFSFTGMVNMENQFLSKLFLIHVDVDNLIDTGPIDYRFENQGYESTSILLNSADSFAFLVLLSSYYIFILIIYCIMNSCKVGEWNNDKINCVTRRLWKFVSSTKEELFVNSLFRILFTIFLDMFFCSILNLAHLKYESGMDIYSASLSLLCALCMTSFAMVICALCLIRIYAPGKLTPCHEDIIMPHQSMSMLFGNLNPEKKYAPLFHIIFMIQRISLSSIIVFLRFSGVAQLGVCAMLSFTKILFLIIVRPFTNSDLNFQEIYSEMVLMAISVIFCYFRGVKTEFANTGNAVLVGYTCILLLVSILMIHYILMFKQICKKCPKKKSKVQSDSTFGIARNLAIRDMVSNRMTTDTRNSSIISQNFMVSDPSRIAHKVQGNRGGKQNYRQDDLKIENINVAEINRNVHF